MQEDKLKKRINALFIFQFLLTIALILLFNARKPQIVTNTQTRYIYSGTQGPQGIPGESIKGIDGITPVVENGKDGKDAEPAKPCSTFRTENDDVVISCPDGSVTTITKPQNGTDGKTVEFRTNPTNCNIEYRYTPARAWITLVPMECGVADEAK